MRQTSRGTLSALFSLLSLLAGCDENVGGQEDRHAPSDEKGDFDSQASDTESPGDTESAGDTEGAGDTENAGPDWPLRECFGACQGVEDLDDRDECFDACDCQHLGIGCNDTTHPTIFECTDYCDNEHEEFSGEWDTCIYGCHCEHFELNCDV